MKWDLGRRVSRELREVESCTRSRETSGDALSWKQKTIFFFSFDEFGVGEFLGSHRGVMRSFGCESRAVLRRVPKRGREDGRVSLDLGGWSEREIARTTRNWSERAEGSWRAISSETR